MSKIKIKYGEGAPTVALKGYSFYLDVAEDTLYEFLDGAWVVKTIRGFPVGDSRLELLGY